MWNWDGLMDCFYFGGAGITRFTKNPRVMCSRTSACSWNTSIKLKPRRPAQRFSQTRWRLAVSRTRCVAVPFFIFLSRYPPVVSIFNCAILSLNNSPTHQTSTNTSSTFTGSTGTSGSTHPGETGRVPRCGARCTCPGVISGLFILTLPLAHYHLLPTFTMRMLACFESIILLGSCERCKYWICFS